MAAVLRREEVAARMNETALHQRLASLLTERVVYFPIRHHSPVCACYLERLIREWRPEVILVEGPASFTRLIPLVLHPQTKAPFAIYTSFTPSATSVSSPTAGVGPIRRAAYYPFCDYSPELVALRVGQELGATLRFIDLDYPEQVRAEATTVKQGASRMESLQAERHFKHSEYLQALARQTGCRDHNDLWDHLFETRLATAAAEGDSAARFIRDVAAWCYFAREDASAEQLESDGTVAREKAMAAAIRAELAGRGQRIIVVTGGFHTVALPQLVAAHAPPESPEVTLPSGDELNCLIRYSYEQLDALNGYAAGMPAPFYYGQLWQTSKGKHPEKTFAEVTARMLVDLGQLTRRKKLAIAVSPADEIAALGQAHRLAALRGHPGPTREDLLDGIRSCFVKGALDAEGEIVLGLAHHALRGTGLGELPEEAGVPPLMEDFRINAQKLRLHINDSVRRKSSLDLYRKTAHRRCSRFFHCLIFLDVPFATLVAGPDFVKGKGLELLFEHWNYQWTPATESHLVEASIYGGTVAEAAAQRLRRSIHELTENGRGRSAAEAVGLLIRACRMGLQPHAGELLELITGQASEDPDLSSLASALNQLVLLWESREPLEAHSLTGIPGLIGVIFERVGYLLRHLANTSADEAGTVLSSLTVVRDLLRFQAAGQPALDATLFYEPLHQALGQPVCTALLRGGLTGLLHSDGRLEPERLHKLLSGSLNAATASSEIQTAFLIGLLQTCRELAWREPRLVAAVEALLATWSQDEFITRLPYLRLAFTELTPRETDQVAAVVAGLHGGKKLSRLYQSHISEADMLIAQRANALVKRALMEDGLEPWPELGAFTAEDGA